MVHDDRVTDDLVLRMYICLASALRRSRKDPFGSPVTVAEIYQDLIPYRTVRSRLGLDMNADYEHTLLRLLAGESDLARLEPREARRELESELGSANPNVGLFRKFAACDVWITATDAGDEAAPAAVAARPRDGAGWPPAGAVDDLPLLGEERPEEIADPEPTPIDASRITDFGWAEPSTAPAAREAAGPTPEAVDPSPAEPTIAEEEMAAAGRDGQPADQQPETAPVELDSFGAELLLEDEVVDAAEVEGGIVEGTPEPALEPLEKSMPDSSAVRPSAKVEGSCSFCDTPLPGGRAVKFCPFCGADQSMLPCGACGEPLERGWRFCIACGAVSQVQAEVVT